MWCLLLGFLFGQFGIINGDSLKNVGSEGFVLGTMFAVILMDLCSVNLLGLARIFPTLILMMGLGVLGSALCALVCKYFFKNLSFFDLMAFALACMIGYPLTLKIAEECIQSLEANYEISDEEKTILIPFYQKKVVTSGIVSVSVVTGVLAGIVVSFI